MSDARIKPPKMQYCTRCVYPISAATPITLDHEGVCSGCRTHEEQKTIDWEARERLFQDDIVNQYRSKSNNYDCIIPVSGGKDSFYQTHLIKNVYKMNPLLVTYNENNETELGKRNIQRMKDVFGVDYFNFTPSVQLLKVMNMIGFQKMGDPDMHAHMGINSIPVIMAVKFGIPLVIWGEHGFMNLGGMHSYNDMVEYTTRYRKEHLLRGYDWEDFAAAGIHESELNWAKYPSDEEIEKVGVRGIFISNYFGWNQNKHTALMVKKYGFEVNPNDFDRTYKRDANLNNIHDNGIHDYMKYIKFGYGRATDHASRDIRSGVMSREMGIEIVRSYDHVIPGDITRWLDYTGMPRKVFETTADKFRSPKVWVKNEYGHWIKDNIWEH